MESTTSWTGPFGLCVLLVEWARFSCGLLSLFGIGNDMGKVVISYIQDEFFLSLAFLPQFFVFLINRALHSISLK